MSDGNYDRALLSHSDNTTATNGRQNKQFYDADLLKDYDEQERQRQTAPASRSQTDLENGRPAKEEGYAAVSTPVQSKPRWYKTRNGIIAIIIVTIIVLGAVIGGAVGGTRGKGGSKDNKTTITNLDSSSSAASQTTGGAGQAGVAPSGGQGGSSTSGRDNVALPTAAASEPVSAGSSD